jgi:hypothetical protein
LEEWEGGSLLRQFRKHFIYKEDYNNRLIADSKQLLDWNRQKDEDSSEDEDESEDESGSESGSDDESSDEDDD